MNTARNIIPASPIPIRYIRRTNKHPKEKYDRFGSFHPLDDRVKCGICKAVMSPVYMHEFHRFECDWQDE